MNVIEFDPKGSTVPVPGFEPHREGVAAKFVHEHNVWAYMGIAEMFPRKGELWFWMTMAGMKHGVVILRAARRLFDREIGSGRWDRLQTLVPSEAGKCLKAAVWLGFEPEGMLRRAGPNDEDLILYGRLI